MQATCAQIFAKQYLLSYNFNFTMKGSKSLFWVFLQHNLSFQFSSCQKSALNEAPFNCFTSNVTSLCVTNFYRTQVYLGSDLWVSVFKRPFADLADATLADEDTNSILSDNANRAIQGNVAMQVTQPGVNTLGTLCLWQCFLSFCCMD